jgi:hypothetical protein
MKQLKPGDRVRLRVEPYGLGTVVKFKQGLFGAQCEASAPSKAGLLLSLRQGYCKSNLSNKSNFIGYHLRP